MRHAIVVGLLLAGVGCGGGVNSGGGPNDDMGDYFPHAILECASPDGSGECVLDFGEALVGIPLAPRTIGLCNRGDAPAVLTHLTTAPPFAAQRQVSEIAAGACVDDALLVWFEPNRDGTFDERLTVYDLDVDAVEVRLTGRASRPWLRCTPETLTAVVPVGGSYTFDVECRNESSVRVEGFAGLASDDGDEFTLRPWSWNTEPGASRRFTIGFEPSRIGVARAVLEVQAESGERRVPVASVSIEIGVVEDNVTCAGPVDFGDVHVGDILSTVLRCENRTDTWAGADYELLEPFSPAFYVEGSGRLVIPPRGPDGSPGVGEVGLTFIPVEVGPATGALAFIRGAEDIAIFPLRGNGI